MELVRILQMDLEYFIFQNFCVFDWPNQNPIYFFYEI